MLARLCAARGVPARVGSVWQGNAGVAVIVRASLGTARVVAARQGRARLAGHGDISPLIRSQGGWAAFPR